MLEERYGLAVSTCSTAALEAYVDGVDRLLSANMAEPPCASVTGSDSGIPGATICTLFARHEETRTP